MPEKICVLCGMDCSSKPRTKDASGRYFCTPCYAQARSRKKTSREAPPPSASQDGGTIGLLPPDDGAGMDWLNEALQSNRQGAAAPCPGCAAPLPAGTVICTTCGYNLQTGTTLQVMTYAAPKASKVSGAMVSTGALHPAFGALVVLIVYGLLATAAAQSQSEDAVLVLNGWDLVYSLTIGITILVMAFRDSIAQGFLTLCVPCYVLYYVFAVVESSWVRWLFGANIAGTIIAAFVNVSIGESVY